MSMMNALTFYFYIKFYEKIAKLENALCFSLNHPKAVLDENEHLVLRILGASQRRWYAELSVIVHFRLEFYSILRSSVKHISISFRVQAFVCFPFSSFSVHECPLTKSIAA